MSKKLLASSSTIEGIQRLIAEYFHSDLFSLFYDAEKNCWLIISAKSGCLDDYIVKKKAKRYRFETL